MSSSRPEPEPVTAAEGAAVPLHTITHDASGYTHPSTILPPHSALPTVPESSKPEHKRSTSPPLSVTSNTSDIARVPTITRHPSHMISLSSPHLVGSIASGAHYAGALSPTKHSEDHGGESKLSLRHVRSRSRSGKEPAVEEAYREVMNDLEELFCGRATRQVLERRIAQDAQFEDPWCKCVGFAETASKFVAQSKLFSKCERLESRILSASLGPNELVFSQKQANTFRLFGTKKTIQSFVHVWLDSDFKVVRMVDEWNGEELPVGRGMLLLRKFNGKVAPWLFHVPKQ